MSPALFLPEPALGWFGFFWTISPIPWSFPLKPNPLLVFKCGVQFGTWLLWVFVSCNGCCLWQTSGYLCSFLYATLFTGWPWKLHNPRDQCKRHRKLAALGHLRKVRMNFWRAWQATCRALKSSAFLGNEYNTVSNPGLKDRGPVCSCTWYREWIWTDCFFTFCL